MDWDEPEKPSWWISVFLSCHQKRKKKSVYILCKEACDMLEVETGDWLTYMRKERGFSLLMKWHWSKIYRYMETSFQIIIVQWERRLLIAGTDSFGIYMAKTDILMIVQSWFIPHRYHMQSSGESVKKIWTPILSMAEHSPIPLTKIIRMRMNILIPPSWKIFCMD